MDRTRDERSTEWAQPTPPRSELPVLPPAAALAVLLGLALLGAVLLAACSGSGRGRAGSPSGPLNEPPPAADSASRSAGPDLPAVAPPGVYLLHEESYGLAACVYVGERTTGAGVPAGQSAGEQERARAALDLADQARWLGGNVVMLPSFREDFRRGRLQGRVYRCGEAERRAIYARAAAEQKLTVIQP
jgi:hypothetical protein